MVIVEADRGHDLGTVMRAQVGWAEAKALKDRFADEHYRWLTMFSRHNLSPNSEAAENMQGGGMASSGTERSPMSAMMGPFSSNGRVGTGVHDAAHTADLKPKLIKRLAQQHEVATLRDKEGNEAKAKRICQQKVNERRVPMEILDAEFQMYVKTFYPSRQCTNARLGIGRS